MWIDLVVSMSQLFFNNSVWVIIPRFSWQVRVISLRGIGLISMVMSLGRRVSDWCIRRCLMMARPRLDPPRLVLDSSSGSAYTQALPPSGLGKQVVFLNCFLCPNSTSSHQAKHPEDSNLLHLPLRRFILRWMGNGKLRSTRFEGLETWKPQVLQVVSVIILGPWAPQLVRPLRPVRNRIITLRAPLVPVVALVQLNSMVLRPGISTWESRRSINSRVIIMSPISQPIHRWPIMQSFRYSASFWPSSSLGSSSRISIESRRMVGRRLSWSIIRILWRMLWLSCHRSQGTFGGC